MNWGIRYGGLIVSVIIVLSCRKESDSTERAQVEIGRREVGIKANMADLNWLKDGKNWTTPDGLPAEADRAKLLEILSAVSPEELDINGEYGGHLRSLFYWANLGDLEETLAIFSKVKWGTDSTRQMYMQSLVASVVSDCPQGSFDLILSKLGNALGDGTLFNEAKKCAFIKSGFSPDALLALEGLKKDDKAEILKWMQMSLRSEIDISRFASVDFSNLSDDVRVSLFGAMAYRLRDGYSGNSASVDLAESVALVKNPDLASELLAACAKRAPDEVWKHLAEYEANVSSDNYEELRSICLIEKAKLNGQVALREALTLPDGKARAAGIRAGLESLNRANPKAAKQWLEESRGSLSSNELDIVGSVWVSGQVQKGDLAGAREIASTIKDDDVRARAEGWIWGKEREQLRGEVQSKPVETVQAIVDGNSKFDGYWLEEAVHTWVSKDFDAANAWYEKNWDSLPKEKAQYVAAGFATQAIGQGDVDTARQWAAMIQDAKTKARIEADIAKAAGQ